MWVAGDRPDIREEKKPRYESVTIDLLIHSHPEKHNCQEGQVGWNECWTKKPIMVDEENNMKPTIPDMEKHMKILLRNGPLMASSM